MKKYLLIFSAVIQLTNFQYGFAQEANKISLADFKVIVGSWQGTLTYMDYSTNKPYTMPANIVVTQIGKSGKFVIYNIYPDEPKANSSDTLILADNGKQIDEENVTSVMKMPNGALEIVTEYSGRDGNDNKPALFKQTYILSSVVFIKTKKVRFDGQSDWLTRHEYSYRKIK